MRWLSRLGDMFIVAARSDRRMPVSPMSPSATSITATSDIHARRSVASSHCGSSSVMVVPPVHVYPTAPVLEPPESHDQRELVDASNKGSMCTEHSGGAIM